MQYQIVKEDETLKLENSNWNGPIDNKSIIDNLEHGDTLYVRLFDGVNVTTNYATYSVINDMKVAYNQISEEDIKVLSSGEYNVLINSTSASNLTAHTSIKRENALTYNYYINYLLLLPSCSENKHKLKKFIKNIKKNYPERYSYCKNRKISLLEISNYILYRPCCVWHRKMEWK